MKKVIYGLLMLVALIMLTGLVASQYHTTTHGSVNSQLGRIVAPEQLINLFRQGNKVKLTTIVSANWQVPLAGLVDLKHPNSQQAGLTNKEQAIQIFSFHIQHPIQGDYLIDSGVSQQFTDNPRQQGIGPLLEPMLGLEKLSIVQTSEQYLKQNNITDLKAVFLTHLHLDHISGLPDISNNTPLYVGKNEGAAKHWMNIATQGVVNTILANRPALQQWKAAMVDIFDDGSVIALHLPGHTPGSTAYLVNDIKGPVLITGDVSHTRWGWENNVGPGQFSMDRSLNQTNLITLKKMVSSIKGLRVHLGHEE